MDRVLENYLEQIDRHLRPMPASERVDVVKEIKSELLELEARGLTPEEITGRLGGTKELAAAYLGDAISKNPRFSWRQLGRVAAFYSLAGLGGIFVLPVTSLLALGFILGGAFAPVAGLVKFLGSLFGVDLPWIMFQFGSWTAPPGLAFVLSIITGALLLAAGRGLWRVTVGFVRMIGNRRRKLA